MDKNYKGLIWTNHALKKMRERGIKQGEVWATWRRPDQSKYAKSRGAWIYYKTYPSTSSGQAQKIEVVAKRNEKKEWVIISVWSRPVFRKETKKAPSIWDILYRWLFGKKVKK